ncbi:MAG TPA: NAD(P)/FAD-dependent oxidoreductase [Candidatus Saccharimonadales bacterium]|nr:NAD(P)/FAD-dependent oxidoreductase [Candidatus Saccharimonadales bacterium]
MSKREQTALIIGAGPAGLTAAYELLEKTNITPIIFEATNDIGGIAKTVRYKGNRIDIGGHRFFSKSDRVMEWWNKILPLQGGLAKDEKAVSIKYQGKVRPIKLNPNGPDPEKEDRVMLVRSRLSRIYYLKSFFDYPVSLSGQTIKNLGPWRMAKIGIGYTKARLFPIRNEKTLEDFFINRFGRELYLTFFKDYTEKVWGISCSEISAEWGAQRIKGLSITKAVKHAVRSTLKKSKADVAQKNTETSLIERFLYPKFGPGQMWETVADMVRQRGGEVHLGYEAVGMKNKGGKITGVKIRNVKTGEVTTHHADYYFSTMPIKDLIAGFEGDPVPSKVQKVARGLMYRDFITVGLLLRKLKIKNQTDIPTLRNVVPDNWIYIQERDVRVGRLQIFNNWSPYLVRDPKTVWVGMEYFVNEGDDLWTKPDKDMQAFGVKELAHIGIIDPKDVLDGVVIRMKKTYPAYFGTYDQIDVIKKYVNKFDNLFLIGRNGMHRYNNQDHSMLTAMLAVENIVNGVKTKDNLWDVNAEDEYHESK